MKKSNIIFYICFFIFFTSHLITEMKTYTFYLHLNWYQNYLA